MNTPSHNWSINGQLYKTDENPLDKLHFNKMIKS